MIQYVQQHFVKGIDRSVAPLLADKGSFYILRNLRHSFTQRGVIEQTPYWYTFAQFSRGTYYFGGSQTEPASSAIRLITEDLIVTDYVCRDPNGQLQVFYQTAVPTGTNVHTGCRLVINSVTGLNITLGSGIDVVIEAGGTTFKWRKNGGAYTTGVAISVSGVSIDGGNAMLYFLASSGFTNGDTWTWIRTDRSSSGNTPITYPLNFRYYKSELYFNGTDDRIMVLSVSTTGRYVISVGYRPVVGSSLEFFDDHLVVGRGAVDIFTGYAVTTRGAVVVWSDKTDVHNFIPTDVNEADQYTLPNNNQYDVTPYNVFPESFIVGVFVVQQSLWLFTNNEAYVTSSLGLPIVFSWQKAFDLKLVGSFIAGFRADRGVYLIGIRDIYYFDGGSVQSVGKPIIDGVPSNDFQGAFGTYDPFRKEAVIVLGNLLYCYQEPWGTWYVRQIGFSASDSSPVKCINSYIGTLTVGVASLTAYNEDDGSGPVVFDNAGTAYASPYLVTQIYGDRLYEIKEIQGSYIGAIVNSNGVSATYYTVGSSITFRLSWYLTPGGDFDNISETIDSNSTWNSGKSSGIISYPRTAFRGIALALTIIGTVSKPPFFTKLNELGFLLYNPEKRRVER